MQADIKSVEEKKEGIVDDLIINQSFIKRESNKIMNERSIKKSTKFVTEYV